jgi:hypothetical protein
MFMKKLCIACLATLFAAIVAQGQNTHFGIKAGLNLASVDIDEIADYDSKAGLHGGLLAHIHITDHFAIQPELVFSCQGGKKPDDRLKLSYLNIPVMAQYMVNDGFRIQTGPQVGFLVSAEQEFGNIEVDQDKYFKTIDFAWAIGAGYIFKSGFGIDARYNFGITDISEDNNFESKNRVFQVGVFYQFKNNSGKKK